MTKKPAAASAPLTVTDRAWAKAEELGGTVSISLAPGGCSGFHFAFALTALAPRTLSNGELVEGVAARFELTRDVARVARGGTLDYRPDLPVPRFTVKNVSRLASPCSCRRSVKRDRKPLPKRPPCASGNPMPWDA